MNTRTVVLLVALGALALAYGWFVLWPEAAPLRMAIVQRPSQPPVFAFNREAVIEEVRITTREPVSADDPEGDSYERLVWHMVPRQRQGDDNGRQREPRPRKMVTYGRRIRGLEPAEGFRVRAEPLKPGAMYHFVAQTSEGVAEATFQAK